VVRGLVASVVTLIVLGSGATAAAHTPDWLSRLVEWMLGRTVGQAPSAGWSTPAPAPDFELVDQHGTRVALGALRGKVVLLNFTDTGCGDACASVRELRSLARALGGKMGTGVFVVSITLDPVRDTTEMLRAFADQWGIGPGWKLLTGSPDVIDALARAYGIYVRRGDRGMGDARGPIEYTDMVLFLDQEGRVRKRVLPHVLQLSGRADVEWLLEGHDHD
jgi:cytochrome oxidase Cu insertion factor (SCO1/SenC/PrrC family)